MALELLLVAIAAAPVALPGCPEACGSVTVPYPFGFRYGCFHAGFNLTCDETHHPPKLFLGDGVEVDDISLAGGTVRIRSKLATFSWSDGNQTDQTTNGSSAVKPSIDSRGLWYGGLTATSTRLAVSTKHNVFVAIGCNFIAYLVANPDTAGSPRGHEYVSTCAALCDGSFPAPGDTSCSGVGCCRTSIAQGFLAYGMQFKDLYQTNESYYTRSPNESYYTRSSSGSAFIVDAKWFSGTNVGSMQNYTFDDFDNYDYKSQRHRPKVITSVPTVLVWYPDLQHDQDLNVFDPHN